MVNGRKVIPIIETPFHESAAALSPDGRWLAFVSDESRRAEVYIQALDTGESARPTEVRHNPSDLADF